MFGIISLVNSNNYQGNARSFENQDGLNQRLGTYAALHVYRG